MGSGFIVGSELRSVIFKKCCFKLLNNEVAFICNIQRRLIIMIEIILETIVVLIFRYPGASIRWLFLRHKRTFKSILKDDPYINAMLSLVVLAVIVVLITYFFF